VADDLVGLRDKWPILLAGADGNDTFDGGADDDNYEAGSDRLFGKAGKDELFWRGRLAIEHKHRRWGRQY